MLPVRNLKTCLCHNKIVIYLHSYVDMPPLLLLDSRKTNYLTFL